MQIFNYVHMLNTFDDVTMQKSILFLMNEQVHMHIYLV